MSDDLCYWNLAFWSGLVDLLFPKPDVFETPEEMGTELGNGNRIGEAKNPGPVSSEKENFRLALIHPTTLLHRKPELLQLNADAIALAETSATSKVQWETIRDFRAEHHTCLFSSPVDNQKQRLDGDTSMRGQAAGTAVIARVPMRAYRQDLKPTSQTRIQFVLLQLGSTTILLCVLYGFQQNQPQSKENTDKLLQEASSIMLAHPGPSVLLGDINHDLETLDSWKMFMDAGFQSSKDIYEILYKKHMPPTYLESSTRDLGIFSPELIPMIQQIKVDRTSVFPGHHPVLFDITLPAGGLTKTIWKIPKNWTELGVNKSILEEMYSGMEPIRVTGDFPTDISTWSTKVESAVDMALRKQHAIDPRQSHSFLPKQYKGRCQPIKCKEQRFRSFAPKARQGDFEPTEEIRSIQCSQLLRQVRRLESIRRRIEKLQTYHDIWEKTNRELQHEWNVILKAKGFGYSFENWICSELKWPYCPRYVPSLATVSLLEQVVKEIFQDKMKFDQKIASRKKDFSQFLDHAIGHDREIYKKVREPPKQFIKGLQVNYTWQVNLHRMIAENLVQAEAPSQHSLETNDVVDCLQTKGMIQDIQDNLITIFFQSPPADLPSNFTLKLSKYGMEPKDIHRALSDYWKPIWNREEDEAENEITLNNFRQRVDNLNFPTMCRPFTLTEVAEWKISIRQLNQSSAPGPDGWHNAELKMLPDYAIKELVDIFNHPSFRGYPNGSMTARVVSLPKVDDPQNASQTRPITILPTLFRLWTATFSRMALKFADSTMPAEITGFIKGRGGTDSMYSLARDIEEAHRSKAGLSGLSLDLTKAFNQFPRAKTAVLMKKMGIPSHIVDQWFSSLHNIKRFFDHRGWVSEGVGSTTGVAEGDAASILAMISISTFWVMQLKDTGAIMKAYADNLSWASPSFVTHRACVSRTVEVFQDLGIPIDWNKTWAWCTKAKDKINWQAIIAELLPPDTELQIHDAANDLGVVQNYGPYKRLLSTHDRLQRATVRLQKLFRQNLPVNP